MSYRIVITTYISCDLYYTAALENFLCLLPQEAEERRRQEADLARLLQDRGEGEEVPLVTSTERSQRSRGQRVELRLPGDQESGDSDDDVAPEEMEEGETDAVSFQNFLKHQEKRDTT